MKLKKWNLPETYQKNRIDAMDLPNPDRSLFVYVRGETMVTHRPAASVTVEKALEAMDDVDREIVCRVAASKYLTSLQVYLFMLSEGVRTDRQDVVKRLMKLANLWMLRSIDLVKPGSDKGIRVYSLGSYGNRVAYNEGVNLTTGLMFVSQKTRMEHGRKLEGPVDAKKAVVGNQILLGILAKGVSAKSFALQETVAVNSGLETDRECILRTSLSVRMPDGERFLFEVVRDSPEDTDKFVDKAFRFAKLVSCGRYVEYNRDRDERCPKLVVCGETAEHNRRLFESLAASGFPVWRTEVLFTEDLEWVRNGDMSVYAFNRQRESVPCILWALSALKDVSDNVKGQRYTGLMTRIREVIRALFGHAKMKVA